MNDSGTNSSDDMVVEITMSPLTEMRFRELAPILQALIFDAAEEVKLSPHPRIGGGHISMDKRSHFGENRLLFVNFYRDLAGRYELFMGALSGDYLNAPPLALLSLEVQDDTPTV